MQDRNIASDRPVSGGALVTVPASVVDWLRRAAYAEIGSAAEALDTIAFATDREDHPERFRGPMQNLREVYSLLDVIGWAKTLPPLGVQLDLSKDSWGLMRVLASALEFADEDISETACSMVEHAEPQDLAPERDAESERVGVLCDFMQTAQTSITRPAPGDAAPTARPLPAVRRAPAARPRRRVARRAARPAAARPRPRTAAARSRAARWR
jgi:hypothetical protein